MSLKTNPPEQPNSIKDDHQAIHDVAIHDVKVAGIDIDFM